MSRHIGVAIPTQGVVPAPFMHDLVKAVGRHAFAFPNDDITVSVHEGALLAESRNTLVKEVLESGADYLVFLDDDMRFPQDLLERMTAHDLPVVAANCAKRRRPISATARKENPDDPRSPKPVWPDPEEKGVEQVAIVGAAVMCIKREVFFQIEYPWFNTPWHEEDQRFIGEDLYFCAQLKKYGVPLYIDHALSWEVGHMGSYAFGMKDVLAERELARQGRWSHVEEEGPVEGSVALVK